MDDKARRDAKEVFDRFCAKMTKEGWKYTPNTENGALKFTISFNGDDLPMEYRVNIDAERGLIYLLSQLPLKMDGDHLVTGAVATSMINYSLINGNFDYDVITGTIVFRIVSCCKDALVSDEVFTYLIRTANTTIDKYNDKLLMVAKDMMSVEGLHKFIKEN